MKIVPISKFEYKVFPINEGDKTLEVTKEEFLGLEEHIKCFNEDLTAVIDYVKTEEEIKAEEVEQHNFEIRLQVEELKRELAKTDYKALKLFEGEITEEEYAETRILRQSLRQQINELESQIITEE